MDELITGPVVPGGRRSNPAIAPAPARPRAVSDLLRLLPYLMPYRTRWIAMVVVAVTSLAATVAIPLMTRAVIDGPVRHQDQHGLWMVGAAATAVGISEAVLWFIRRWLVARATMGVEADVRKDLDEGQRLGVKSTPTYFIDGTEITWIEDKVMEDFLRTKDPSLKSIEYQPPK